jgi:hypothetical protein
MLSRRNIPSLANSNIELDKIKNKTVFAFMRGSFFRPGNESKLYLVQIRITTGLACGCFKNCKQFPLVLWIIRQASISRSDCLYCSELPVIGRAGRIHSLGLKKYFFCAKTNQAGGS